MKPKISPTDMARFALYFALETETFPVFKEWCIKQAETEIGREWAENLTIEKVSDAAIDLYYQKVHGGP